ncbi:MAG: nitrate reductase, partial [Methylococcaceae bacterium]
MQTPSATAPIQTTCPYCGVGCGVIATLDGQGGVTIQGDPTHPANFGRLCSKGAALADTVGLQGRLLYPEIDGYRVDWQTALDRVAARFGDTIREHGPDAVAFYVSGQLLTEDYYLANKLIKGFIGSANIDTNSRLCMSSTVIGHKRAFGEDIVPGCYEDFELADLVVLVGSNTAWCHPVLFQRLVGSPNPNSLQKGEGEKGCRSSCTTPRPKIVTIDPRRTATSESADLHLAIQPGSDVILFNGLLHYLRSHGKLDFAFLEHHAEGYAEALQAAADTAPNIPAVAVACGVAEKDVAQF